MTEKDEAVTTLIKLGLSASGAKTYLALHREGGSTASAIAKITQIDRAETYRQMTQLQKQGLIKKIITYPTKYEAIPLQDLITILIENKKKEIYETEKKAKQLKIIKDNTGITEQKEQYIILIPRMEMVIQRLKENFNQYIKSIQVLSTIKRASVSISLLKKEYWSALERDVKITFIVEKPSKKKPLPDDLKALSRHPNFCLKFTHSPTRVPVVIVDEKIVWITSSGEDYLGAANLLTNNDSLIELAQEYFKLRLKQHYLKQQ